MRFKISVLLLLAVQLIYGQKEIQKIGIPVLLSDNQKVSESTEINKNDFVLKSPMAVTFINKYSSTGNTGYGYNIEATFDGGYIACAAKTPTTGSTKGLIIKTDGNGTIQWQLDFTSPLTSCRFYDIKPTIDGGYVACGEYSSGAPSTTRALIVKLNSTGTILWTKTYVGNGSTGSDVRMSFKKVIETTLGYTAVGFGSSNAVSIIITNTSGTTIYNAVYLVNTSSVIKDQCAYYVGISGAYCYVMGNMAGDASNAGVFYMQFNASSMAFVSAGMFYNSTYQIAINDGMKTADGGFILSGKMYPQSGGSVGSGLLIKLSSVAALSWAKQYDVNPTESEGFHHVEVVTDGFVVSGHVLSSLYPYPYVNWLVKTDLSGNVLWNNYPGIDAGVQYGSAGMGSVTINGDGTMARFGQTKSTTEDLAIMTCDANGQFGTGCNNYSETITTTSLSLTSATRTVTAKDLINNSTDIISNSTSNFVKSVLCTGTNNTIVADFSASSTSIPAGSTVNFTDLSSGTPTSWSWTLSGGTPSTSTAQNPSGIQFNTPGCYTISLTATNASSSDSETKTCYINVTSTNISTAINSYTSTGNTAYGYALDTTNDGGYILAAAKIPSTGSVKATILKTSPTGTLQWQRDFTTSLTGCFIFDVISTSDGGYIGCGEFSSGTPSTTRGLIVKLDATGTVTWLKTYVGNGSTGSDVRMSFSTIRETSLGYIATGFGSNNAVSIIIVNNSGTTIYNAVYLVNTSSVIKDQAGRVVDINSSDCSVIGSMAGDASNRGCFIMKFNPTTMAFTSASMFYSSTYQLDVLDGKRTSDGGFILCGRRSLVSGGNDKNALLVKTDAAGVIVWAKQYDVDPANPEGFHKIEILSDGYLMLGHAVSSNYPYPYTDWLVKTDFNGVVQWNNYPGLDAGVQYPSSCFGGLGINADGSIGRLGQNKNTSETFAVMTCDPNGQFAGCNNYNETITTSSIALTNVTRTVTAKDYINISTDIINNSTSNFISSYLCGGVVTETDEVQNLENTIIVYPNPAKDHFYISSHQSLKNADVCIYDAMGKVVFAEKMNGLTMEINLKNHSKGIYFIRIVSTEGIKLQKLIID